MINKIILSAIALAASGSLAAAQQELLGSVSAGKIPGYINRASNTAANQFSTEVSRITRNLGF